jgi:hypothetical protein
MEAEGELEHVLEIIRQHGLPAAMCQPIGIERDERAAND